MRTGTVGLANSWVAILGSSPSLGALKALKSSLSHVRRRAGAIMVPALYREEDGWNPTP